MKAQEILLLAVEANEERGKTHGKSDVLHGGVAAFWSAFLQVRGFRSGDRLTPSDVARMMALFKLARTENGCGLDDFVDMAGYAALAGELEGAE